MNYKIIKIITICTGIKCFSYSGSPTVFNVSENSQYNANLDYFDCGNNYYILAGQGYSFQSDDNGGLLNICQGNYKCSNAGLARDAANLKLIYGPSSQSLNPNGTICSVPGIQAQLQAAYKSNPSAAQAVYQTCTQWYVNIGSASIGYNTGNSSCTPLGGGVPMALSTYIACFWNWNNGYGIKKIRQTCPSR
jgi:hypothetical protein